MLFHKFYSIVYTVCEFGERLAIWKIDNRKAKQQVRPVYTWNSLKYLDEKSREKNIVVSWKSSNP